MILHNDSSFKIYFGDIKDDCVKFGKIFNKDCFVDKIKKLNLKNLVFLKQTHGNEGLLISSEHLTKDLILFESEGDFIITKERGVGIGVFTADCLPVTFYDSVNNAIGIAHIGWKGAVNNIVTTVIRSMQESFGSKVANLKVYIGSSAKVCCYQVKSDFLKNLENSTFLEDVILKKDSLLYLDLPRLVSLQLLDLGVTCREIRTNYNDCTICNQRFHSYRRSGQDAGRQATIISLL